MNHRIPPIVLLFVGLLLIGKIAADPRLTPAEVRELAVLTEMTERIADEGQARYKETLRWARYTVSSTAEAGQVTDHLTRQQEALVALEAARRQARKAHFEGDLPGARLAAAAAREQVVVVTREGALASLWAVKSTQAYLMP